MGIFAAAILQPSPVIGKKISEPGIFRIKGKVEKGKILF